MPSTSYMGKLKLKMIQSVSGLHVYIYMYLFHEKYTFNCGTNNWNQLQNSIIGSFLKGN
jgi:hypothetical protein